MFKSVSDISRQREYLIELVPAAFGIGLLSRMNSGLYYVQFDYLARQCQAHYGDFADQALIDFCDWRADTVAVMLTISFMLTVTSWCVWLYETMKLWYDYTLRGERRQQLRERRKQVFWWSVTGTVFCALFITGIHTGLFVPAD